LKRKKDNNGEEQLFKIKLQVIKKIKKLQRKKMGHLQMTNLQFKDKRKRMIGIT
jgi:hypothetical protein